MRRQAVRFVIYSQIALLVTIVTCSLLDPGTIIYRGAISTFGILPTTMWVFVIGLLAVAGLLLWAARLMPNDHPSRVLALSLRVIAACLIGIAATPYDLNLAFAIAHGIFAGGLLLTQMVSGAWMLRRTGYDRLNAGLYTGLIAGVIVAILSTSELDVIRLMIVGQLTAVFTYSALLMRAAAQIEHVDDI